VALIGCGALAVSQKNKNENNTPNTAASAKISTPASNNDTANQTPAANVITYTNNGFAPAGLSVKSGSEVTVKNDSSQPLQFDSDPHPAHTDDPELNVGLVPPGQNVTFKVTTTGNHGYHNHLIPGDTGTLIVE
jgi:plastocyanin